MRVLVTGARGLLGSELVRLLGERGHDVHGFGHADLDVTDPAAVEIAVGRAEPEVVINCAAYTNVDGAEQDPGQAMRVNGEAAGVLASLSARCGARFVHASSDYVFAGDDRRPRREDDPTAPASAYARSKAEGERQVLAAGGDALVVRGAWLYGRHGKNFVDSIRKKAEAGEALRVVIDQVGSPTWAVSFGEGLCDLLAVPCRGIVHLACRGEVSWYDLAKATVAQLGLAVPVVPIRTAELARPAARPAYSALDVSRFSALVGREPSDWRTALHRYLRGAEHDAWRSGKEEEER